MAEDQSLTGCPDWSNTVNGHCNDTHQPANGRSSACHPENVTPGLSTLFAPPDAPTPHRMTDKKMLLKSLGHNVIN